MKILQNAGHLNADSGFGEWDWMLEEITELNELTKDERKEQYDTTK